MRFPKIHLFSKLISFKSFSVVVTFLFGLVGVSYGAQPTSIYEAVSFGQGMDIGVFTSNVAVAGVLGTVVKGLCGPVTIDDVYTKRDPAACDSSQINPKTASSLKENGISSGGLVQLTTSLAGGILDKPTVPTNLALYMDYTFGDNVFGVKPTYAQGALSGLGKLSENTDPMFSNITFELWKQTRNIALALMGVLLAVGAFGIMFRQKLSPQAVVTIGSVLPHLPIALAAIVLSYPVVSVFLNLVTPLTDVARNIASLSAAPLLKDINLGGAVVNAATGFFNPVTFISALVAGIIGGGWIPAVFGIGLIFLIVCVALAILVVIVLIRFIYEMGKIFITWVLITIAFPLIAAFSILPGRQGSLVFVFKKLLANLLVLPIMWFTMIVGLAIMANIFATNNVTVTGSTPSAWESITYFLGGSIYASLMKFALGFAMIWGGLGARKHLENAFGVQGSVMSVLTPAPPQRR